MKSKKGFSFVELNIAISLFLIAVVAAIGVLSYCSLGARKAMELSQSAHLAQSKMAELMYMNADQIAETATPVVFPSPFNKYSYTITKSNTTNPALLGIRELKITVIGSTGVRTTLVKLIRGAPSTWAKVYNSGYGENGTTDNSSIRMLSVHGGYIVMGGTDIYVSWGISARGVWVFNINSSGDIQWQKTYARYIRNYAWSDKNISPLAGGGYVIFSNLNPVNYNNAMIFKTNNIGEVPLLYTQNQRGQWGWVQWVKSFTFPGKNVTVNIIDCGQVASDGSLVISMSYNYRNGGNYMSNSSIIKLMPNAIDPNTIDTVWLKNFKSMTVNSIMQDLNGNYIFAGTVSSYSLGTYSRSGNDGFILKLDASTGSKIWQKIYGSTTSDEINCMRQTSDRGYILAGNTRGFSAAYQDGWFLKLDALGNRMWSKRIGGPYNDNIYDIQQTSDGGYIAVGFCQQQSNRGDDIWVVKLDAVGNSQWQRYYGSPYIYFMRGNEQGYSIIQTSDGSYMIAGRTNSYSNQYHMFIIKTDSNGNCPSLSGDIGYTFSYANIMVSPYWENLDANPGDGLSQVQTRNYFIPDPYSTPSIDEDTSATVTQVAP